MVLGIERINRMFYPVPFSCLICFLLVPIQAIIMRLPHYQIILAILIHISHDYRDPSGSQLKFFMKNPFPFQSVFWAFIPSVAYDKITGPIIIYISKAEAVFLCRAYYHFGKVPRRFILAISFKTIKL